jgi:hypothetical protein
MTQAETAKLTAEMEHLQLGDDAAPDWTTLPDLLEMQYELDNPLPEAAPIRMNYGQCVVMYKALDKEIKEREVRMKDIKTHLQAALMVSGTKKVRAGEYAVQLIDKAGARKIVAEKLMARGVTPQVIAESTEIGKGSQYLDIRSAGEK